MLFRTSRYSSLRLTLSGKGIDLQRRGVFKPISTHQFPASHSKPKARNNRLVMIAGLGFYMEPFDNVHYVTADRQGVISLGRPDVMNIFSSGISSN